MSELNQSDPVMPTPMVMPLPVVEGTERTEELVGKMLDEALTEQEVAELEQLLTSHPAARSVYVSYMRLHTELLEMFGDDAGPKLPQVGLPMGMQVPADDR